MSRLRSKVCAYLVLALLALVSSAASAQDSFVAVYLTWNGAAFDGYHATEDAVVYQDGVRAIGSPYVMGWRQGSTHGLLEFNFIGNISIDTVGTYDPAGLCRLIGFGGAAALTRGDTTSETIPLRYNWCAAGVVPAAATGAGGLIEFRADAALSFTDSVSAGGGYETLRAGAKAGQFPHGSPVTIIITPLFGSSVQALGRTSAPGQSLVIDTVMNSQVVVHANFYFAPTFTITLGGGNPAGNDTIAKGTTKSPMIEFSMNPSTTQTLSSVMLSASGTGDQHTDIEHVKLYEDLNGNGKVDGGEPLLGSGAYGVDGTMTLTVDPAFSFTGPTNFLVTHDFNVTIVQELVGGTVVLAMFPLLLLPVMRRRRRTLLLGLAMLTVSVAALSSCGGSDTSTGPPPAKGSSTYQAEVTSVTVSGTAHPTTLTGHTVTILK